MGVGVESELVAACGRADVRLLVGACTQVNVWLLIGVVIMLNWVLEVNVGRLACNVSIL